MTKKTDAKPAIEKIITGKKIPAVKTITKRPTLNETTTKSNATAPTSTKTEKPKLTQGQKLLKSMTAQKAAKKALMKGVAATHVSFDDEGNEANVETVIQKTSPSPAKTINLKQTNKNRPAVKKPEPMKQKKRTVDDVEQDSIEEENGKVEVDSEKKSNKKPPKRAKKPKKSKVEIEELKKDNKQEEALAYVRLFVNDREAWKFKKVQQIWLLSNLYEIPEDEFDNVLEYIKDLQGSAREKTKQEAKDKIPVKETKAPATVGHTLTGYANVDAGNDDDFDAEKLLAQATAAPAPQNEETEQEDEEEKDSDEVKRAKIIIEVLSSTDSSTAQSSNRKSQYLVSLIAYITVANALEEVSSPGTMLLPVWNHPTEVADGAPAPQATACANSGQIALTYNEGPSDVTAKVLNGLKAAQAKANFFVNATWLYTQQYAMILQRAYNDGHFIGMTYRAPGDTSEGLTDEQIKTDVTNTAKIIETLIGVAPKYVRLHYSQPEDIRLENIIRSMGYTLVSYNLDTMDYNYKNNPEGISDLYKEIFAKQIDTYDSKGSFISVQYDIPDTGSWQAIYDVVRTINEAGYTMVRLDGCLNDKQPYKEHAGSTKFVSDKHSLGQADYKSGQITPEKPANTSSASTGVSADAAAAAAEEEEAIKKATGAAAILQTFKWLNIVFTVVALYCTWAF
ncbi:hypothetical protein [Parasitella parasitica]|uniref:NodB homology domain-containing protein n=1 Tax=Parasitella parasitica TaxID=35722 RepID=A0A0B7NXV3_9FUNG|nr:hypothetical protein [Parasitella parasitica]